MSLWYVAHVHACMHSPLFSINHSLPSPCILYLSPFCLFLFQIQVPTCTYTLICHLLLLITNICVCELQQNVAIIEVYKVSRVHIYDGIISFDLLNWSGRSKCLLEEKKTKLKILLNMIQQENSKVDLTK